MLIGKNKSYKIQYFITKYNKYYTFTDAIQFL